MNFFFAGKDAAADSGSHTPSGGSMAQKSRRSSNCSTKCHELGQIMPPAVLQFLQATQAVQQRLLRPALPLRAVPLLLLKRFYGTEFRHNNFGGQSSTSSVQSVSQSQSIPDSEFGWDRSQFDSRAGFGSPADSVNLNHQSSSTSEFASAAETAAKEEAVAAENQRKSRRNPKKE